MTNDAPSGPVIRPVSTEEFPEYYRTLQDAFSADSHPDDRDNDLVVFEPERSLAVFDGDQIVGTAGAFSRQLTLPGRAVPVAAVTMVGVAPTHRRRGLLTAMMRRQLTEVFEGGREAVAALWASEGAIYGRFGYGLSTHQATLTGRTDRMRLRPGTDLTTTVLRQVDVAELPLLAGGMRERLRLRTVGWLDRPDRWWRFQFHAPERRGSGAGVMRAVVCEQAGEVTGYAAYQISGDWQPTGPEHKVRVHEMAAATAPARAATWSFLINLDLVRWIRASRRPVDEPLRHLVTDGRALGLSMVDNLWVRTVDVGRALSARCYAHEVDVVLDVTDDFCRWNVGRWRLSGDRHGAECARTTSRADLALSSTELGAALLGGTALSVLAAAGRVRELRPGILARASGAFATDRAPWCPDIF
ncbi:MAG TPA: GNAT family N-acetyltransferase [Mycobacteriales bacterium]|nr:GNAT family N-acetyltransferase [Mycobacteriales bacterium]